MWLILLSCLFSKAILLLCIVFSLFRFHFFFYFTPFSSRCVYAIRFLWLFSNSFFHQNYFQNLFIFMMHFYTSHCYCLYKYFAYASLLKSQCHVRLIYIFPFNISVPRSALLPFICSVYVCVAFSKSRPTTVHFISIFPCFFIFDYLCCT